MKDCLSDIAISEEALSATTIASHRAVSRSLAYEFKDPTLLQTALTHKSVLDKGRVTAHGYNNERLEFLGDAVLSLVTADYLYRQNGFMNEGELTRLRAQFVCQEHLSQAGKKMALGDHIQSDKAMKASGSTNSKAVLADAVEAIFGAVFIDAGLEKAQQVIVNILGLPTIKLKEIEKDAKTKLQELVQANFQVSPRYSLMDSCGPAHAPTFVMAVAIKEDVIARGTGSNKKLAEQNAASLALLELSPKALAR